MRILPRLKTTITKHVNVFPRPNIDPKNVLKALRRAKFDVEWTQKKSGSPRSHEFILKRNDKTGKPGNLQNSWDRGRARFLLETRFRTKWQLSDNCLVLSSDLASYHDGIACENYHVLNDLLRKTKSEFENVILNTSGINSFTVTLEEPVISLEGTGLRGFEGTPSIGFFSEIIELLRSARVTLNRGPTLRGVLYNGDTWWIRDEDEPIEPE